MAQITLSHSRDALVGGLDSLTQKGCLYYIADIIVQLAPCSTDARIAKLAVTCLGYQALCDLTGGLAAPKALSKHEWTKESDFLSRASALSGVVLDVVISIDTLQSLALIDIAALSATMGSLFTPFVSCTLIVYYTIDMADAIKTVVKSATTEERREHAIRALGATCKVAQQALMIAAFTQPPLLLALGVMSSGMAVVRFIVKTDEVRELLKVGE